MKYFLIVFVFFLSIPIFISILVLLAALRESERDREFKAMHSREKMEREKLTKETTARYLQSPELAYCKQEIFNHMRKVCEETTDWREPYLNIYFFNNSLIFTDRKGTKQTIYDFDYHHISVDNQIFLSALYTSMYCSLQKSNPDDMSVTINDSLTCIEMRINKPQFREL